MKTIKQLSIVLCAAALFAGCNKAELGDGGKGVVTPGEPCDVNLVIATSNTTRGISDNFVDATDLENKITVLEFYVFDSAGNPDVEVGRVNETTPGKGYKKVNTATGEKVHKITMAGGTDKKIVAVINMNLGELTTNTYAGLKAQMSKWAYTHTGSAHNARVEDRTLGFEMTGEEEFTVVSGTINTTITVDVSRLSSRINAPKFNTSNPAGFINLETEHLEEIWGDKIDEIELKPIEYRNDGYVVINGRTKSDVMFIGNADGNDRKNKTIVVDSKTYVVPDWNTWSSTGKTALRSSFDASGFYTNTYSGKGAAADWFLNGATTGEHRVYLYENKPGEITTPDGITGWNPGETNALIIKGTFIIDGDTSNANGLNKTRYWRVDLTRDDDYHIYRNANYDITINRISTPGYATPEEAENENPVIPGKSQTSADVKIVVSQWRLNNYATDM